MRRFFSLLFGTLAVLLWILPASAMEPSDPLSEGIDPEAGLEEDVVTLVGPYSSDSGRMFPDQVLALLREGIHRWNLLGLGEGLKTMGLILCGAMLCGVTEGLEPVSRYTKTAGCLAVAAACTGSLHGMVGLGTETIRRIHEYIQILLPGILTLMTASGNPSGAGVIQIGGVVFFDLLLAITDRLLIPLIYLYAGLSTAEAIMGQGRLNQLRDFIKWLFKTLLKWLMLGFSGFLTAAGLFTEAVDANRLRSLRSAIGGMVPVVGGIVSDASQSLLAAAGALRISVGAYGMLAVLGICFEPFLRLALQYFLMKLTTAACGLLDRGSLTALTEKMTEATGMILGLVGISCVLSFLTLTLCVRTVAP